MVKKKGSVTMGIDVNFYAAVKKTSYNKGLYDAWELAKKVFSLNRTERKKAFGCEEIRTVVDGFDIKEALDFMEAYEKEQAAIKVGDIVHNDDTMSEGIVTYIDDDEVYMLYKDGSSGVAEGCLTKTGKHIEIQKILEQIAGD